MKRLQRLVSHAHFGLSILRTLTVTVLQASDIGFHDGLGDWPCRLVEESHIRDGFLDNL
jgi:hypothetical protein